MGHESLAVALRNESYDEINGIKVNDIKTGRPMISRKL
jgi:hypothetical protein